MSRADRNQSKEKNTTKNSDQANLIEKDFKKCIFVPVDLGDQKLTRDKKSTLPLFR